MSSPAPLVYNPDDPAVWAGRDRRLVLATITTTGPAPCRLVLCKVLDQDKYVVWWENIADSERVGYPATFQGDYFDNAQAAVERFLQRAERANLPLVIP